MWLGKNRRCDSRVVAAEPMRTFGERTVRQCGRIVFLISNPMGIRRRLDLHHKQISRRPVVSALKWQIACEWVEGRNETFWIVVPAIGVTTLMVAIVLLLGR